MKVTLRVDLVTLFEEQNTVFDSVFGLLKIIFFRVPLCMRMRKISLTRRRRFKRDSDSVSLPSETIAMITKPRKTT